VKPDVRAVLFDLDGTLADSLADLANATNWRSRNSVVPRIRWKAIATSSATARASFAPAPCPRTGRIWSTKPCA